MGYINKLKETTVNIQDYISDLTERAAAFQGKKPDIEIHLVTFDPFWLTVTASWLYNGQEIAAVMHFTRKQVPNLDQIDTVTGVILDTIESKAKQMEGAL